MDTLDFIKGAREDMAAEWLHTKILKWLTNKLNNNASVHTQEEE